jgi:hypothetical protein
MIALEEMVNYSDFGGVWTRAWNVFARPLDEGISMCYDRPILSQNTMAGIAFTNGFPPSLGPFTALGGFKCTYKGTEDELGVLLCDGVENMWCEKAPDLKDGCGSLFNPVYIASVVCRW